MTAILILAASVASISAYGGALVWYENVIGEGAEKTAAWLSGYTFASLTMVMLFSIVAYLCWWCVYVRVFPDKVVKSGDYDG